MSEGAILLLDPSPFLAVEETGPWLPTMIPEQQTTVTSRLQELFFRATAGVALRVGSIIRWGCNTTHLNCRSQPTLGRSLHGACTKSLGGG